MYLFTILLKQLMIMSIFICIGYILFKKKMITVNGSKELSNLLLYIVLPAVIINSYNVKSTPERVEGIIISFIVSLIALILSICVCALVYGKRKKIEHFGVSFSNAGFMGIPIATAIIGNENVFYISAFVALLNILQWTYGVVVMTESKDCIKLDKLIKNPILIAMVIGLSIFFLQIPVPEVATKTISSLASLNAPTALIILGVYLAQTDIKSVFVGKEMYITSFIRLVFIPVFTLLMLYFLPINQNIKLAVIIAASAPIGSNVAVFAQIYNLDYKHAVKTVCLTTILSVISMPFIIGGAFLLL